MSEIDDIRARRENRYKGYSFGVHSSQFEQDFATLLRLLNEAEAERDALQALVDAADPIIEAVAHIGVDFGYGAYELEEKHIHASRVLIDQKESE